MKYLKCTFSLVALMLLSLIPLLAASDAAAEDSLTAKETRMVASVGEDGVQRVEVSGGEYYFEPNHIVVQVNKPVELLVRKVGSFFIPHNIMVKAPEAGIDFDVGMDKDFLPVRFTPTRTGKYTMSCDKSFLWFETHQHKGMEGIIEVVE